MEMDLSCFKAYDIRGRYPTQLNPPLAFALGRAIAAHFTPDTALLGHDARLSGPALHGALAAGLRTGGVKVSSLGLCGTEEVYDATARHGYAMGVMVTGSHNPADENGFKLVRAGAVPVSADSGLPALRERVATLLAASPSPSPPSLTSPPAAVSHRAEYVRWLLAYSGFATPPPGRRLKIVADCGNGCAGLVLRELAPQLPLDIVPLRATPDGRFPNGVPNPLLPERRAATAAAVREHHADMGVAWDGDFDRCFLYDATGRFIEGYYLVGLLAHILLRSHPGARIIHDTRLYWNTREMVSAAGGVPLMGKTGHAFMKERLRAAGALYGGELSAHYYFRDFHHCDSGMLPWLLVACELRRSGGTLAALVEGRMAAYPCSGEINRPVDNAPALLHRIHEHYAPHALHEDSIDGINLEFADWRFNLRPSNTEPLLRLNVESRGDAALVRARTAALLALLDG